jgi:hypothetical protein
MDIRTKAVHPTARLHLRDASDELMYDGEKEVAVNIYGPGSKQFAKAQAAQTNRMMDSLKRKGKTDQTAEQKRTEQAEFLAECTESFENLSHGAITAGHALAVAVYSDIEIGFIADQVAKHIGDWSNFSKPSATN